MYSTWALFLAVLVWGALGGPYGWPHPQPDSPLKCQTPWKDCGSTGLKIDNVSVQGCCSSPCKVVEGKAVAFSYTFTPDIDYKDLNQSACAMLGPVCVPFPNQTFTDVCKSSVVTPPCPFMAGKTYNVTVKLVIPTGIPNITTIAKWQIYNTTAIPENKAIGCFEVPVQT